MSQKTYLVGGGAEAIRYWQDLACANRKVAEDNQTRLAAVTKGRDEALMHMEILCTELVAEERERKNLSRLADEVMKHQWSNSREAMTALQELMDALPKGE